MTIQEAGERLVERLGLLQVRQMRGRGNDDELRARQILVDLARHRYRGSGILLADDDERGNLHFLQARADVDLRNRVAAADEPGHGRRAYRLRDAVDYRRAALAVRLREPAL